MAEALAAYWTPLTREEHERAQDLIYEISPVEGEPRLPEDWTPDEARTVARFLVRGGVWEVGTLGAT